MTVNGHIIMLWETEQNINLIGLCLFPFSNASIAFSIFCFVLFCFNVVPDKFSHYLDSLFGNYLGEFYKPENSQV